MISYLYDPGFVIVYIIFNFFLSLFIYFKNYVFFNPCFKKKSRERSKDIHDSYPEFRRNHQEKLSFSRIFLGLTLLVWIRLLLSFVVLVVYYIYLNIILYSQDFNDPIPSNIDKRIRKGTKVFIGLIKFILGLVYVKERVKIDERIYRKHLGGDYVYREQEANASIIISNSVSWMDSIYMLYRYAPSLVLNSSFKKYIFIGYITKALGCVYFNERNKNSIPIEEKLKDFFETDLDQSKQVLIFPESTSSSGSFLLSFNNLAFIPLKTIKPLIIKPHSSYFSIAQSPLSTFFHFIISQCFLYHNLTVYELPVINPTSYLYTKLNSENREKYEVYKEAVRNIYRDIGHFEFSDKNTRDKNEYLSLLKGK